MMLPYASNRTASSWILTLSLHDALPILKLGADVDLREVVTRTPGFAGADLANVVNEAALLAARKDRDKVVAADFMEARSEEHTSELQSRRDLVCRLRLEKKK